MVDDLVRQKGYLTLGSRLKRIGESLQAEVQQLMQQRDVPIQANQYPLLTALDENGSLTIGELAEALGVSQPGITRSVGLLVELGCVSLKQGRTDHRKKIVTLTLRGRRIVDDGRRHIWPHIERRLARILDGQSGPLLEQLDVLEDSIGGKLFKSSIE